jgi:AhpD family alkylhydroperoxidase
MVGRRELMTAFISKANRCEYCTKAHGAVAALAYEAGVLAMAEDVWAWCEKSGFRGRTVTVKIKWADFQQSTRGRSMEFPIDSQGQLNEVALTLIRFGVSPDKRHTLGRRHAIEFSLAGGQPGRTVASENNSASNR